MTFRQAAACLNVSPATAHRWWRRYAQASLAERHSLAWAADRSSRPHRSPRLLQAGEQEQICEVVGTPAGGLVWWLEEPATATQRSGRCSIATGYRGARASPVMLPGAMSGRAPA